MWYWVENGVHIAWVFFYIRCLWHLVALCGSGSAMPALEFHLAHAVECRGSALVPKNGQLLIKKPCWKSEISKFDAMLKSAKGKEKKNTNTKSYVCQKWSAYQGSRPTPAVQIHKSYEVGQRQYQYISCGTTHAQIIKICVVKKSSISMIHLQISNNLWMFFWRKIVIFWMRQSVFLMGKKRAR